MKLHGFHEGDRSEIYAKAALSKIGHAVQVPRTEDYFGVDFLVRLFEPHTQKLELDGLECSVQIKSQPSPIEIKREHERRALFDYSQPLFIGIFDKSFLEFSLYTTLLRFSVYWANPTADFSITFGGDSVLKFDGDNVSEFSCGEPIVRLRLDELENDKTKVHLLYRIVQYWIRLEMQAITNRVNRIPTFPFHSWTTNEIPGSVGTSIANTNPDHLGGMVRTALSALDAIYLNTFMHLDGKARWRRQTPVQRLATAAFKMKNTLLETANQLPQSEALEQYKTETDS